MRPGIPTQYRVCRLYGIGLQFGQSRLDFLTHLMFLLVDGCFCPVALSSVGIILLLVCTFLEAGLQSKNLIM